MNKLDLLIGIVLGFLASFIGSYLFIVLFTDFDFSTGLNTLRVQGSLGKLVTLGSILDLILFAVLLKLNKEMIARGVIIAVIILAVTTIFL